MNIYSILIIILLIILALLIYYRMETSSETKTGGNSLKELVEKFTDGEIITQDNFPEISTFFPSTSSWKRKQLQMTKEGIFSTTNPKLMNQIMDLIEKITGKKMYQLTVTDATSNVGGSAIALALKSKFTNAVEIDPTTCKVLENNINIYGLTHSKRIAIYCEDYLKIMDKLVQDVVFIDPPWGGVDYKSMDKLSLFLSDTPLVNIVNQIKGKAKLVVLKLPMNFDKEEFEKKNEFGKITYHKIKKFLIATLIPTSEN